MSGAGSEKRRGSADHLRRAEVLLGEPYSYEVDAWSLGTMLYEMLAGVTPFWSEDHATSTSGVACRAQGLC